jgi:magnesium chelatase subunit ChlD-like protein
MRRLFYKITPAPLDYLHIVLLDSSASLLSQQGLSQAKGVLQYLCQQLHQYGDLFTLITFGNQKVETVYPVQVAPAHLDDILDRIQGGGGTPLNQALQYAYQVSQSYKHYPQALYILSDARSHEPLKVANFKRQISHITVVDMECNTVRLGKAKALAEALQGQYLSIQQLAQHS